MRQKYRTSKSFRDICQNYQKCSEAFDHWAESKLNEAPDRQREYRELLKELELEILKSLNGNF
jgi:hypothetical protein